MTVKQRVGNILVADVKQQAPVTKGAFLEALAATQPETMIDDIYQLLSDYTAYVVWLGTPPTMTTAQDYMWQLISDTLPVTVTVTPDAAQEPIPEEQVTPTT